MTTQSKYLAPQKIKLAPKQATSFAAKAAPTSDDKTTRCVGPASAGKSK